MVACKISLARNPSSSRSCIHGTCFVQNEDSPRAASGLSKQRADGPSAEDRDALKSKNAALWMSIQERQHLGWQVSKRV